MQCGTFVYTLVFPLTLTLVMNTFTCQRSAGQIHEYSKSRMRIRHVKNNTNRYIRKFGIRKLRQPDDCGYELSIRINRKCFFIFDPTRQEKWGQPQARSKCRDINSDLAMPMDKEEYFALVKIADGVRHWIAAERDIHGIVFYRDTIGNDKIILNFNNFTDGGKSRPGYHRCVVISDFWHLVDCTEQHPSICQIRIETTTNTLDPSATITTTTTTTRTKTAAPKRKRNRNSIATIVGICGFIGTLVIIQVVAQCIQNAAAARRRRREEKEALRASAGSTVTEMTYLTETTEGRTFGGSSSTEGSGSAETPDSTGSSVDSDGHQVPNKYVMMMNQLRAQDKPAGKYQSSKSSNSWWSARSSSVICSSDSKDSIGHAKTSVETVSSCDASCSKSLNVIPVESHTKGRQNALSRLLANGYSILVRPFWRLR